MVHVVCECWQGGSFKMSQGGLHLWQKAGGQAWRGCSMLRSPQIWKPKARGFKAQSKGAAAQQA